MDAIPTRESPIFLRLRLGERCAWLVIENLPEGQVQPASLHPTRRIKSGGSQSHLSWVKTRGYCHPRRPDDWIRQLKIPEVDHRCHASSIAVVNRRMFTFGGNEPDEQLEDDPTETAVSYLDLDGGDECAWTAASSFEMGLQEWALASPDGWVYCFGHNSGRFNSHTFEWQEARHLRHCSPLAVSTETQIVHRRRQGSQFLSHLSDGMRNQLEDRNGYVSGVWCPSIIAGGYMLCVSDSHPVTGERGWNVFAYNIEGQEWMKHPVQGLIQNGLQLPMPTDGNVAMMSMVKVGPHRYALVWSRESQLEAFKIEVHWVKFDLVLYFLYQTTRTRDFKAINLCHHMCTFENVRPDTTVVNITSQVDTVNGDGEINREDHYLPRYELYEGIEVKF